MTCNVRVTVRVHVHVHVYMYVCVCYGMVIIKPRTTTTPIAEEALKLKPLMIVDCNNTFRVDKLDQLMSYYSFLHKSVKWRRKVFFWILEVAVVNAYIIYKELALKRGDKLLSHFAFR